jgi:DNA-binding transcriptional ArsR family regulator
MMTMGSGAVQRGRSTGRVVRRSDGAASAAGDRLRAIRLPEVLEIVQLRLRVIGDPTSVQIMVLLDESGGATVQELADRMPGPVAYQNVSRHLRALYEAGMMRRKREGHFVRYGLDDWTSLLLLEQVAASVEGHLDARGSTQVPMVPRRSALRVWRPTAASGIPPSGNASSRRAGPARGEDVVAASVWHRSAGWCCGRSSVWC